MLTDPEEILTISLSRHEQRLLLDDALALDAELVELVQGGRVEGDQVRVQLSVDEMEALLDAIAAAANHANGRRRQDLEWLYEWLAEEAWPVVVALVPEHYEIVLRPAHAVAREDLARAA